MILRIVRAVSLCFLAASFSAEAGIALAVGSKASLEGAPIVASISYEQQAAGVVLKHEGRLVGTGTRIFRVPFTDFSAEIPVDAYGYLKTVQYRPDWLEWADGTIINHSGVSGTSVSKLCVNGELFAGDPLVKNGLDGHTATGTVVPYATSAKEAVKIFGERMKSIGAKAPMSVIFADDDEVWIAEAYSGHEWAASRLPDDSVAVILGLSVIGALPGSVKEESGADAEGAPQDADAMMSENIAAIAENAWAAAKKKSPAVLSQIFSCGYDGASQVISWTARDRFAPEDTADFDRSADYAGFFRAQTPIDMKNVFAFMRSRIETELKPLASRDKKAKSADAKQKETEKILINGDNASKAVVFQHRKGKQDFMWLSLANPEYSPFVPFYADIKTVPDSYAMGSSSFASGISYWVFKLISEGVENDKKGLMASIIKKSWKHTEQDFLDEIDSMDIQYLDSDRPGATASLIAGSMASSVWEKGIELTEKLSTAICGGMVEEHFDPFDEELPGEDPRVTASKQAEDDAKSAAAEIIDAGSASENAGSKGGTIAAGSASVSVSDEYRPIADVVAVENKADGESDSVIVQADAEESDASKAIEKVRDDSAEAKNASGEPSRDVSQDAKINQATAKDAESKGNEAADGGSASGANSAESMGQEGKSQEKTDEKN